MRLDIGQSALAESQGLCSISAGGKPGALAFFYRILTVSHLTSGNICKLPRLGERQLVKATQAHVVLTLVEFKAIDPRSRTANRNGQVQTEAIGVHPRLWRLRACRRIDVRHGQSVSLPARQFIFPLSLPILLS